MEWRDEGLILGHKRMGEDRQIVSIFTRNHGRCGGLARHAAPVGALVSLTWHARLEDQLGAWRFDEVSTMHLASVLGSSRALQGMTLLCALLYKLVPERFSSPPLFEAASCVATGLTHASILSYYAYFEAVLLCELGFGNAAMRRFACEPFGGTEDEEVREALTRWTAIFRAQWPFADDLLALRHKYLMKI